jgi:ribonuclease P protein component
LQSMGKFRFSKSERLHKRNAIQELFEKGSSFYLNPFKIIYQNSVTTDHHQVLFSVSKRNFKKAVDRNLIKRRMREAYRLNKHILPESPKRQIAYIYIPKEILTYKEIETKLIESLKRLHT